MADDFKNIPAAYEVISTEYIDEIKSMAGLLRHIKTGARVVVLSNEDENKVFNIGFRTPPQDSTGVAHIMEHSVLCGSKNFPAKDPFIELAKGSLNTFLNAMTYPDKTIYPVASCNDADFQNLMHVYLDAVFYPNIYAGNETFRQEGWHYELEDKDAPLIYNGVVYNEMKGAFSSPEQLLYRKITDTLFPDNVYGVESGGDPDVIPELTYEQYLDFHKKYYHPSNSYIYLYGNMDVHEKLDFIDKEYLQHYDALEVDSSISKQAPFEAVTVAQGEYPIGNEDREENASYMACSWVVGDSLDPKLYLAFQILEYTLMEAPGAPLKQALLDQEFGEDVYGFFETSLIQPYLSIIIKII
ncbi:MAG: insulinase family protein, partial [Coprococcus sp.]